MDVAAYTGSTAGASIGGGPQVPGRSNRTRNSRLALICRCRETGCGSFHPVRGFQRSEPWLLKTAPLAFAEAGTCYAAVIFRRHEKTSCLGQERLGPSGWSRKTRGRIVQFPDPGNSLSRSRATRTLPGPANHSRRSSVDFRQDVANNWHSARRISPWMENCLC